MSSNSTASIDWSVIDTLLVDMDGTILDLHFDDYFWQTYLPEHYSKHYDGEIQGLLDFIKHNLETTGGELNWYCPIYWSELLKLDILLLKEKVKNLLSLREDAIHFLKVCRKNNKRLILVTNAHPEVIAFKNKVVPFLHYFDKVVSSHDIGVVKESLDFWDRLNKKLQLNFNRCAFIDDSYPVLLAAKKYGVKNLFCVAQPNSKKIRKNSSELPILNHFSDVISKIE